MLKHIAFFILSAFIVGFTLLRSVDDDKVNQQDIIALYKSGRVFWPEPSLHPDAVFTPLSPLEKVKYPSENQYSKEKEILGKALFFDPRLSVSGSIACASCHDPELGWADGRRVAFGHARRAGKRNAMSILNVAFYDSLFWDGRAANLEVQALQPIADEAEMNLNLEIVTYRIDSIAYYKKMFLEAFGEAGVSRDKIAKSIATYERGITSRTSPFDRFVSGDTAALSDDQIMGLHLFRTKAKCINCHNGSLFSDNQFHNLGQAHLGRATQDLGRYLVTGDTSDVGKFRTPSLRDVMFTGPYLHHGLIFNIEEVIDMYDRGMPQMVPRKYENDPLNIEKSGLLQPLNLSRTEKQQLLAFLEAISVRPFRVNPPELNK